METLAALAAAGWETRARNFAPSIRFSYPRKTRAVSVTGGECRLNCAHCGGHYLRSMEPLAAALSQPHSGVRSFLISGGCTAQGKVPIFEHLAELEALKGDRRFNVHAGLVDEGEIAAIARIADCVSFDFIGDDATISEVLGINRTVADYVRCYRELRAKCTVIPHICIGLHGGEIRGEDRVLELLDELGADGLTFIVLKPTKGTRFAGCTPPSIREVCGILAKARQMFPRVAIKLGCMRPVGGYRQELDQWAVRTGVNDIVNPAPAAVRLAQSLGLAVARGEECCVL